MIIREIQKKDNNEVEKLIRDCLIEFGANKQGCAWSDPNLGCFYEVYSDKKSKYFVVEHEGKVIAGCGIGPVEGLNDVCELQKMYSYKDFRGCGIAKELLYKCLEFAKEHYKRCYIETFSNMVCANKFYIKHGFKPLDKPIIETEHYACDTWYIKEI